MALETINPHNFQGRIRVGCSGSAQQNNRLRNRIKTAEFLRTCSRRFNAFYVEGVAEYRPYRQGERQ